MFASASCLRSQVRCFRPLSHLSDAALVGASLLATHMFALAIGRRQAGSYIVTQSVPRRPCTAAALPVR
jgi:hypothetical protein